MTHNPQPLAITPDHHHLGVASKLGDVGQVSVERREPHLPLLRILVIVPAGFRRVQESSEFGEDLTSTKFQVLGRRVQSSELRESVDRVNTNISGFGIRFWEVGRSRELGQIL